MEDENKQHKAERGREGKDSEKPLKKQHFHNLSSVQNDENSETSETKYLNSGVFDFPWLGESVISKTDDCMFQDMFALSLENTWTAAEAEHSGQCLWQTPISSSINNSIANEFEDNSIDSYEGDGLDGTWASLLSQPLEGGSV